MGILAGVRGPGVSSGSTGGTSEMKRVEICRFSAKELTCLIHTLLILEFAI